MISWNISCTLIPLHVTFSTFLAWKVLENWFTFTFIILCVTCNSNKSFCYVKQLNEIKSTKLLIASVVYSGSVQWNFFSQRIDELHSLGALCNYKTLIRLWNYTAYGERRRFLWCTLVMTAAKRERGRELPAFASFESLERNQSFESEDFCTLQLPHPLTLLLLLILFWSDSETKWESSIDPGNVQLFWYAEATGMRAFWLTENVCHLAKGHLQ